MDAINIIIWWLCILLFGFSFLPLTSKIFRNFYDKGFLFSKSIGLITAGFITWLLTMKFKILNFEFGLLPFRREIIIGIFVCLSLLIFIIFKAHKTIPEIIKTHWKIITIEEIIFLSAFVFWAILRAMKPQIQDLEKYMDFGFMNSVIRSEHMHPIDMWFAGNRINYYYFGHYIFGYFTKFTSIVPSVAYNLSMATLFGLCFALSFSLILNITLIWKKGHIKKAAVAGIISALLISLGGNLHSFVFGSVLPLLKSFGLNINPSIEVKDSYWFPDATRYVGINPLVSNDQTIHEFPIYSFVVSDLHAHVINIIFVLTILGILVSYIQYVFELINRNFQFTLKSILDKNSLLYIIYISFFVGTFQMTNYWDFPIYLGVSVLIFAYLAYLKYGFSKYFFADFLIHSAACTIGTILINIPFKIGFEKISDFSDIRLVQSKSAFYQLLILYGHQLFFFIAFFVLMFQIYIINKNKFIPINETKHQSNKKVLNEEKTKANIFSLKTIILIGLIFMAFSTISLDIRIFIILWTFAFIFILTTYFIYPKKFEPVFNFLKYMLHNKPADVIIFILLICAMGLVFAPEFIYIKDIYEMTHPRANTMFKLTYQGFSLFALAIGYVAVRIISFNWNNKSRYVIYSFVYIMIMIPLTYAVWAIHSWYTPELFNFDRAPNTPMINYQGLDGIEFLKKSNPEDYYAIMWINQNIKGQPVLLEANGDSYTYACRISMATGLPTIQGWYVHEWLWHNSYQKVNERVEEVKTVYESSDMENTLALIKKYNVEYIYIGNEERKKFKNLNEQKLLSMGEIVYSYGDTKLIHLNKIEQ